MFLKSFLVLGHFHADEKWMIYHIYCLQYEPESRWPYETFW
jgi:hypothetical protein